MFFESIIPVRGRKPLCIDFFVQNCRTIPVRGRKRPGLLVAEGFIGTIPVRGRRLDPANQTTQHRGTIPVRGRELWRSLHHGNNFSTIPVRGRKLLEEALDLVVIQYHPRKGSKTSLPCHQSPCTRFQLLPARGRKLDAHVVGVRSIDFNLSPQGDRNVICCRSSPCNADFDLSP